MSPPMIKIFQRNVSEGKQQKALFDVPMLGLFHKLASEMKI